MKEADSGDRVRADHPGKLVLYSVGGVAATGHVWFGVGEGPSGTNANAGVGVGWHEGQGSEYSNDRFVGMPGAAICGND